jgi:hypothetical protein
MAGAVSASTLRGNKMKIGDLVRTRKGNVAIVLDRCVIARMTYVDVLFLKTKHVRTGFPAWQCEVISENR